MCLLVLLVQPTEDLTLLSFADFTYTIGSRTDDLRLHQLLQLGNPEPRFHF